MEDLGVPREHRKSWFIKLPLPDNSEYLAFNGVDQRALVAVVDALTKPGVTTPSRIIIEVSNV